MTFVFSARGIDVVVPREIAMISPVIEANCNSLWAQDQKSYFVNYSKETVDFTAKCVLATGIVKSLLASAQPG